MLPAVRDALAAAAWLLRSGQRSREALIILTLAAEVWRQRAKVARLRKDRAEWRQVAAIAMEKPARPE
jgi:hypothetical protein